MAKDPRTDQDSPRRQAEPPVHPEGWAGPPEPRLQGRVRRRPKGWLRAIAERFGAYPAED